MSRSLSRFVGIMNALASGCPNASLAEIAAATGLDKSTTHRLLAALDAHGLVRRDSTTKRYAVGPTALSWGASAFDALDVRAVAEPVLRRLNAETRETASLWVRDGNERICVSSIDSPQLVRHVLPVGLRLPLTQGAGGKLTLALMPPDEAHALIDVAPDITPERRARLLAELPEARRLGYALSVREITTSAWSMAAPVVERAGPPSATVVIAGPSSRLDAATVGCHARALVAAAQEISRLMGASTATGGRDVSA